MTEEITINIEILQRILDKATDGPGYGCIGLITEKNGDICFIDYPSPCPLKEECLAIARKDRGRNE